MTTLAEAAGSAEAHIDVAGRRVRVTNLDRIVWPETGTRKLELLGYYLAIAPLLLPHLRGRPTMLWRFPEGVDGPGWFQAQCRGRPAWVPTHEIVGRRGERLSYCLVEEPATLVWLANLGTIELHPHNWTVDRPDQPVALILDLDPGPPAGLASCARVAVELRRRLAELGLEALVKSSGGLGLHVAAALAPGGAFDEVKRLARDLAESLVADAPELVIATNDRAARVGRVYVDWIQNDANRQTVAPYSLRATPLPGVSTPLEWSEVEAVASGAAPPSAIRLGPGEVLERVARRGDLWADLAAGT